MRRKIEGEKERLRKRGLASQRGKKGRLNCEPEGGSAEVSLAGIRKKGGKAVFPFAQR